MDPFLGEIKLFSYQKNMTGWALCDGSILPVTSNQALFALLGPSYGGDGRTTFGLPDLRGRVPACISPTLPFTPFGAKGGVEAVTLLGVNMPAHNHPFGAVAQAGTSTDSDNTLYASVAPFGGSTPPLYVAPGTNRVTIEATSVQQTGGGTAHPNVQPFLVLAYYIATQGLWPPRN